MQDLHPILLLTLIVGPVVLAALVWLCRAAAVRIPLVVLSTVIIAAAGILLAAQGRFTVEIAPIWGTVSSVLELAIILLVLGIGIRIRSWLVFILSALQFVMALAGCLLKGSGKHASPGLFIIDPLSIILVLIITLVGSLIVIYAIGYMNKHEEHCPPTAAPTPRFFFFLIAFLGLMNGLVLTDDLKWLSFFWEGTTLCSFFLIAHDGTDEARKNARRALIINTFGGAAMTLAMLMSVCTLGTETVSGLMSGSALIPIALLCLAALTKSAQMPFQSWLLGAMVAPTPVSALLHSSTMVKAGSYLVLRLAPAIGGTALAPILAVAGAFTFAVTSALAISQSNGKKVLAYSTIANLGLIVACAGINTPLAYAAALTILCFHAVSKALLFLCVGTVEQTIGSRDIEDMSGILHRMPFTAIVAVLGMISMVVPPFGMLIGKWMAIEAAVCHPLVLLFVIIGSALTVFFWAKWIGRITTVSYHPEYHVEKISVSMVLAMSILITGVVAMSLGAFPMYRHWFKPVSAALFHLTPVDVSRCILMDSVDSYMEWPLFAVLFLVIVAIWMSLARFRKEHVRLPFLCGENLPDDTLSYDFRSLMDAKNTAYAASVYMVPLFGEAAITAWANLVAAMIILAMFGALLHGLI